MLDYNRTTPARDAIEHINRRLIDSGFNRETVHYGRTNYNYHGRKDVGMDFCFVYSVSGRDPNTMVTVMSEDLFESEDYQTTSIRAWICGPSEATVRVSLEDAVKGAEKELEERSVSLAERLEVDIPESPATD